MWIRTSKLNDYGTIVLEQKKMFNAIGKAEAKGGGGGLGKKKITKEGLSEYFLYTIEGTETIPNNWAKRLPSFESKRFPLKICTNMSATVMATGQFVLSALRITKKVS